MPGFNPKTNAPRVATGNTVVVLIGDQAIAFAQTVDHRFDFGTEKFYGIGTAMPQEIQQLRVSPEITLNNFALTLNGNNLLQNGTNFGSILANNQFNIAVLDNAQQVRYTYINCVARDYSMNIPANRPITENITFDSYDVVDQSGQSILNGPLNAFSIAPKITGVVQGGLGITP